MVNFFVALAGVLQFKIEYRFGNKYVSITHGELLGNEASHKKPWRFVNERIHKANGEETFSGLVNIAFLADTDKTTLKSS